MKIKTMLAALFADRRNRDVAVEIERRGARVRMKEADRRVKESMERLSKALKDRGALKREVANDIQTVVHFPSFAAICKWRVPGVAMRLCRNPQHEASNTGVAECNEEKCPFMRHEARSAA